MIQITDKIMMIRPANFGFNPQTAANNSFQSSDSNEDPISIKEIALEEFDNMVTILKEHEIEIITIQDTSSPVKPDAVFPNNWISFHSEGVIITYPMWAKNRRIERREEIVEKMAKYLKSDKRYSFEYFEEEDMFLEGTGSMLLDRENKIVYACLSPRTDIRILDKFCVLMGYRPVTFYATDRQGEEIYHTNVMMALAEQFAVVCLESIKDETELNKLKTSLDQSNKTIVDISMDQVEAFAGNMLQVSNKNGVSYLIMSLSAFEALSKDQVSIIESFTRILAIPIPTIQKYGGGSVRCMMAEVFD